MKTVVLPNILVDRRMLWRCPGPAIRREGRLEKLLVGLFNTSLMEARLAVAAYPTEQVLHGDSWTYHNGRVCRWSIGALDSERSSVVVEKVVASYSVRLHNLLFTRWHVHGGRRLDSSL